MMAKNLIIENSDKILTINEIKDFIESFVTLDKIEKYLSRSFPDEISGHCKKKKYYIGHGVCLYYKFLKKEAMCARCDSDEILNQLNYILKRETSGSYRAIWKTKKRKKRRKKNV